MLVLTVFLAGAVGSGRFVYAQSNGGDGLPAPAALAAATDFSIPSAPAFGLLDVSPSNVFTPAYPRDLRIDWILSEDRLASDFALEMAPVWVFGFRSVSASEYRDLSYPLRHLASLDVSVATAQRADDRFLSAALKLTLYTAADPLADAAYTTELSNLLRFPEAQTRIQNQIDAVVFDVETSDDFSPAQRSAVSALADAAQTFGPFLPERVDAYQTLPSDARRGLAPLVERLVALHSQLQEVEARISALVEERTTQYEVEHWNATRVDVAAGRVYTYTGADADDLTLATEGWGGWVTGATGLGTDRVLATGMARAIAAETAGAEADRYFVGLNLRYRYGPTLSNAFVEYIRRWGDPESRHEIAYGGSVDLTDRLNVQFGLRTAYDDDLDLRSLLPTLKINGQATDLLGAL